MKHCTMLLTVLFLISSCTLANEKNIHILSFNKVVDITTPGFEICENFQLNEREISSFFQVAGEISNEEADGELLILPCKYEGNLTMNNQTYLYEIFAGGTGFIYDKDGWVIKSFICQSINCCTKFSDLC